MVKKRIVLSIIVASLLTGCGAVPIEQAEKEQQVDPVEESSEGEQIAEEEPQADLDAPWRKAYLDFLNTDEDIAPYAQGDYGFTFTLIYLDDDDVPELFVDTGVEAGGQFIVGFYNGEIVKEHFRRIGSQYIEKSGLVYTNTGHMDYYPVDITKYENGEFTVIGSGISYVTEEDWKKMTEDENYPYTLTYEWENEQVTEDEFNAKVAELYDLEKSKFPDNFNMYKEFTYQLETGKWISYDHTYELIIDDVTWNEAQEICKQKGGYLATITCTDEAKKVSALIQEQGLEDYAMFVGYRDCEWIGDTFYSNRWINADGSFENVMPAMYDFWKYNWPDYDYHTEEWRVERQETDCGLAKYSKLTDMIYIFEAPDELLTISPQYTGKMGFICEYD